MMSYEDHLVEHASGGNREAFDALVEARYAAIYRFVLRHVGDADEAADLTQNTFVKAYLGLPQLRDASKFEAWLYRIALNECRMAMRSRGAETFSLDEIDPTVPGVAAQFALPSTEDIFVRDEAVRAIRRAIDELSERDRDIACAFFIEQQPYAQIERQHGISHGALATRIHRIRKAIFRRVGCCLAWLAGFAGWGYRKAHASTSTGGIRMKITGTTIKLGTFIAIGAIAWSALTVSAQDPRAQCQNNLKHLGLAFHMYMQDYDDKLPPADKWCDALRPYTTDAKMSLVNGRRVYSEQRDEHVLHCPAAGTNQYGYAMNVKLSGLHRVLLSKPAETVLLYESSVLRRNGSGIGATIADRHDDGAVYLYVDGHIKWFSKNEKPKFDVPVSRSNSGLSGNRKR